MEQIYAMKLNGYSPFQIELELAKTAAQKDKELTTMKMNLEKNGMFTCSKVVTSV